MTTYATYTRCSVEQSKGEIRAVLAKYGGDNFSFNKSGITAVVRFNSHGHRLRFHMPVPWLDTAQEAMSAWRSLLLVIKAKLQSVESGIETFEEAFLAQIEIRPDKTVGEEIIPTLVKPIIVKCRYCGASNRLPSYKDTNQANCGQCHRQQQNNRTDSRMNESSGLNE